MTGRLPLKLRCTLPVSTAVWQLLLGVAPERGAGLGPQRPWLAWRRASGRGGRRPGPYAVVPGSAQRLQTSLPEAAEHGKGRASRSGGSATSGGFTGCLGDVYMSAPEQGRGRLFLM